MRRNWAAVGRNWAAVARECILKELRGYDLLTPVSCTALYQFKTDSRTQLQSCSVTGFTHTSALFELMSTHSIDVSDTDNSSNIRGEKRTFDSAFLGSDLDTKFADDPVTDGDAAARFVANVGKENFCIINGDIWMFSDHTGLWTDDKHEIGRRIKACGNQLRFEISTGENKKPIIKNYAMTSSLRSNMLKMVPDHIDTQNNFFEENANTAVGKLLFSDGIYNMVTGVFTSGFDNKICVPYTTVDCSRGCISEIYVYSLEV